MAAAVSFLLSQNEVINSFQGEMHLVVIRDAYVNIDWFRPLFAMK